MGNCFVPKEPPKPTPEEKILEAEKKISKEITRELEASQEEEDFVLKLLLLGTGESGKSTIFKQLVQLHGQGFDEKSRVPYKSIIYTNIILSMKTLIRQSNRLPPELECKFMKMSEESVKIIEELKNFMGLDEEVGRHIKKLWADPGIKKAYLYRSRYQLCDECKWFFERIDEIAKQDYVPSYNDILRCRARTTGISESTFSLEGNKFRMLDVGGQRNERKKWYHCFEGVTAVIFVAAINEYDQVLYEDGVTNRLHESLDLFGEICNSPWFRKTAMIIFLNKSDIFREKIKEVDLKCCFADYEGGCNYDNASEFLRQEFVVRNEYPRKKMYVHITCATNTENINYTFSVIKDIIVKTGLNECGLV